LSNWLDRYYAFTDSQIRANTFETKNAKNVDETPASVKQPSFLQVLDWITILVDAHLYSLLLRASIPAPSTPKSSSSSSSTQIFDLLSRISSQSSKHIALCEQGETLHGLLAQFVSQQSQSHSKSRDEKQPLPDYSIEIVKL
jgi:hypothetical protein